MNKTRIEIPVECQNGHKATAQAKLEGLEFTYLGVPREQDCKCPKWDFGQGWTACGKPTFTEEKTK